MVHGMDRQGLKIPEDLSVIAFAGNDSPVKLFRPPITTVVQDCDVMVRHAVELMERLTNRTDAKDVESIIIQPEIAYRQSVENVSNRKNSWTPSFSVSDAGPFHIVRSWILSLAGVHVPKFVLGMQFDYNDWRRFRYWRGDIP